MIDLYRFGTTAKHVAVKFGVSLRSVNRAADSTDGDYCSRMVR
jgi:hypothetical protein